jgi:hypothetical protein
MSDDIYINIDDEQPKPVDVVQVEFDKQDVYIDVQQDYAPVLTVNGKVGYVTLNPTDIGLNSNNVVYITGNQTVSGVKTFKNQILAPNVVYSQSPSIQITTPIDALIKYTTGLRTGVQSYTGIFFNTYFTETPILFASLSYDNTQSFQDVYGQTLQYRYIYDFKYINSSGFAINFSDIILNTGINLNILAYGKAINS